MKPATARGCIVPQRAGGVRAACALMHEQRQEVLFIFCISPYDARPAAEEVEVVGVMGLRLGC